MISLRYYLASRILTNIYEFSLGFDIENLSLGPWNLHFTQRVLSKSYIHIIQASITHIYIHLFCTKPNLSQECKTTTRAFKTTCIYQSYVQDLFLNLMGLVLVESITTGQDICLLCFVLTSFPTTLPRDLISNFKVNGTTAPFWETVKVDPAPYRGTLLPFKFTTTVLWLFLGW